MHTPEERATIVLAAGPALKAILVPVARLCLRRAIRIQDAVEMLKTALVEVAAQELKTSGAEASVSKISAMTGLHRRDVSRLLDGDAPAKTPANLIGKIIGQWRHGAAFTTKDGKPRVLSADGKNSEFAELVHSVSKDLNPYTILFEFQRLGYVAQSKSGLKLLARSYIPSGDLEQGLMLLAADTDDLLCAVEQNLIEDGVQKNLHLKTEFDNIAPERIEEIGEWLLNEGSSFHRRAELYLSRYDRDLNPAHAGTRAGVRVALGSFSRMEQGQEPKAPQRQRGSYDQRRNP